MTIKTQLKKGTFMIKNIAYTLIFLLLAPCCFAAETYVPKQLEPWKDWVLEKHQRSFECAPNYLEKESYECEWPEKITFRLFEKHGEFVFKASLLFEGWLELPGNSQYWPQDIKINGMDSPIFEHGNKPALFLDKGDYSITGGFVWNKLPESIAIPPKAAFVELFVKNEQKTPNLANNQLWIKKPVADESIKENIELTVYRLLDDQIPFLTTIYLQLRVSGPQREISFKDVLPEETIPLKIEGSAPTKIQDRDLILQVRPGNSYSAVTLRHIAPVDVLSVTIPKVPYWPTQEVWSMQDQPHLRVIKISGVTAIDPNQTLMPAQWKNLPSYLVTDGQKIVIETVQRGASRPHPDQISIEKNIWLRSDGNFVAKDTITGLKNTDWRLEAQKGVSLGRVAINGKDQFITRMSKESEVPGVEIRQGTLNLEAESIFPNTDNMSVSGWQADFQSVKGRLNLPPGYSILLTKGIDQINGTIIQKWNLLAIFLLLITTIAAFKLYGITVAGVTFATFLLTMHDYNAALWSWLLVFATVALLKVLPDGSKSKYVIKTVKNIVLMLIAFSAIPYMIDSIRVGVYPQLERTYQSNYGRGVQSNVYDQIEQKKRLLSAPAEMMEGARVTLSSIADQKAPKKQKILMYDPTVYTQTGPGLPELSFKSFYFSWNRPVSLTETYSIIFLTPKLNLILAILKSIALSTLLFMVSGIKTKPIKQFLSKAGCVALFLSMLFGPAKAEAATFPSQEMLQDLETRLTQTHECSPNCVSFENVSFVEIENQLNVTIKANAVIETATPLPTFLESWSPGKLEISNNNRSYEPKLLRKQNTLWALLAPGSNRISFSISTRANEIQLPFMVSPRNIEVSLKNWQIAGMENNKNISSVMLTRVIKKENSDDFEPTKVLPSYVQVTRKLTIGLNWTVTTTVQRKSPPGAAIPLEIPLIEGENVISDNITVKGNHVKAILNPQDNYLVWESTITPVGTLNFINKGHDYTETWQVEPSAIWHLEHEGLVPVYNKQGDVWLPTWQPLAGESLTLRITRPIGANGQTLTIDRVELKVSPGTRLTDFTLDMNIRSSHGAQHGIKLPSSVKIQALQINEKNYPVQSDSDGNLLLPISPGAQTVRINFRQSSGITSLYTLPQIDLRQDSANHFINVKFNRSRWPLFLMGGETVTGPAVLFWSYFLVMLVITFLLSKTHFSPLKFYQWLLLAIGLSQISFGAAAFVAATIIGFGIRSEKDLSKLNTNSFNGTQFLLAASLVISLGIIIVSISMGLLGSPDMVIRGNNSSNYFYKWYQDYTSGLIPTPTIVSLPMVIYRAFMLAWALWISFSLIKFLKWGWEVFSREGIWKKDRADAGPGQAKGQKE